MTKIVPALFMDGIIVTITHSPFCWGLLGGPQTPLYKNTVLKHFPPEIVFNCLPQRNLYVRIHDPLKASEEERNLNDGKLWTWFGLKLLQRSDSTLTHEVIKLTEENISAGWYCVCSPFSILILPTTPLNVTAPTAVRVRNTSGDVTDYITFPDRRWDVSRTTAGQRWALCTVAMATGG